MHRLRRAEEAPERAGPGAALLAVQHGDLPAGVHRHAGHVDQGELATAQLLGHQVRRGALRPVETAATPMEATWYATTLPRDIRPGVAGSLRRFLGTPEAMHLMRSPAEGVPPSRFRPPVYVTIWS